MADFKEGDQVLYDVEGHVSGGNGTITRRLKRPQNRAAVYLVADPHGNELPVDVANIRPAEKPPSKAYDASGRELGVGDLVRIGTNDISYRVAEIRDDDCCILARSHPIGTRNLARQTEAPQALYILEKAN